jgi:hypothetical protein
MSIICHMTKSKWDAYFPCAVTEEVFNVDITPYGSSTWKCRSICLSIYLSIHPFTHQPIYQSIYRDVTAESRNSGARARRSLLSNGSEITFPLQCVATNESLPGNNLLNTRFPWQPPGQQRAINRSKWCLLFGPPTSYKKQWIREFKK